LTALGGAAAVASPVTALTWAISGSPALLAGTVVAAGTATAAAATAMAREESHLGPED
jgi:hypothetical protein